MRQRSLVLHKHGFLLEHQSVRRGTGYLLEGVLKQVLPGYVDLDVLRQCQLLDLKNKTHQLLLPSVCFDALAPIFSKMEIKWRQTLM